jgi:hypothetical protein
VLASLGAVAAVVTGGYSLRALYRPANTPLWGPVAIPATVSAVIGRWESTDRARLRFTKDGWFDASDLPIDMTDGMRGPCADRGKWSIDQFDETQPPEVDLRMGLSPQCAIASVFPLQMERVHSRLELYFYIGDPDDDDVFVFAKQPSAHGATRDMAAPRHTRRRHASP